MAVQDDLAAALSAISNATNALNSISGQATAAINQVTATYNSRISTLNLGLYVNQITGLDSNPGTAAAPLRSLQAAVDKAPLGAYLTIILQTDYTTTGHTMVRNKFVVIASDSSVRRRLNFGLFIDTNYTPNARVCYGFLLSGNSTISLFQLGVVMPAMGAYNNYQDRNSASIFKYNTQVEIGTQAILINSCDFDIPTTGFGALVLDAWPITLVLSDLALTGAVTSINGRMVRNVTNPAGTATTTLPYLTTSLANI